MPVSNNAVSRSRDASYLFYFLLLANLFQYMEAGAVPALLVTIADSFQMDAGQQGLLGGVVYLSLGVGGPCAGYLLKNFSHKLVVVGAVISNMLCTVFWAMTPVGHTYSTSLFIVLRFLMGLCQCIICVYLPLWTNENAPRDKRTTWMSYLQASVPLGVMLGYIVASVFMNSAIASEHISAEEVAASSCAGIYCWRWPFLIEIFLLAPLYLGLYFVPEIDMDLTVRKRNRVDRHSTTKNAKHNTGTDNDVIVAVQDLVLSTEPTKDTTALKSDNQENDIEMMESNDNLKGILKPSVSNQANSFFETPNKPNSTSVPGTKQKSSVEGERTQLLPMGTKSVDRNHTLKKQIGDLFAEDVTEKKRRMSLRRHSMNASLFDPLSIRDVIRRSHDDLSMLSFQDTPRTGGVHMQPLESSSSSTRHPTDTIPDVLGQPSHIHSNYSSTGDFLTLLPEFSWEGVLPPSHGNSNRSSRGSYQSYHNNHSAHHAHRNQNSEKYYYFDSEDENDLDSEDADGGHPGGLQRSQSAHVRSGDKHYHHKHHLHHQNSHFSCDDASLSYYDNNNNDGHAKVKDASKKRPHNNRHSVPARFKYHIAPSTQPDSMGNVQKVHSNTAVVSYESLRDVHRRQQAEGGGGRGSALNSSNRQKRRTSSMGSTFTVYKEGEDDENNEDDEFFHVANNLKPVAKEVAEHPEADVEDEEEVDFNVMHGLGETPLPPATTANKPRYQQISTENVDTSFPGYASGSESESDDDWFSPVKLHKQQGKFFPTTPTSSTAANGQTNESDSFFVQNRPSASDMEANTIPLPEPHQPTTGGGIKRRRKAWYKALYKLMSIGIYRNILGAMTCLYFTVTGVQFWGTKYLTIALHAPLPVVNTLFVLCAATGPTLGVFFGGYLIDSCIGGYHGCKKRFQTLRICALLGILGASGALPITFVTKDNIYLVTGLLWCALFFGGATLPACSGILVSMVPREYRPLSSSVSMVVFNMCGYFASLIVSGYLMAWLEDHPNCFATLYLFFFARPTGYDTVEHFETAWECNAECAMTWGFRLILGWSFFSVCFIVGAYRDALRQYQRREEKKRVLQAAAVFAS